LPRSGDEVNKNGILFCQAKNNALPDRSNIVINQYRRAGKRPRLAPPRGQAHAGMAGFESREENIPFSPLSAIAGRTHARVCNSGKKH
jgi:hypothetical protein